MTDRTTKALLLAIAVGLRANLAAHWLTPVPVRARDGELRRIRGSVEDIERHVRGIAYGGCINSRLC